MRHQDGKAPPGSPGLGLTRFWGRVVRAYAFPITLSPLLLGALAAHRAGLAVQWAWLPLIIVCTLCLHGGTNLINDYFDFRNGTDVVARKSSTWALTQALLKPTQVLRLGRDLTILAVLLSLPLLLSRSLWLMGFMLLGVLGGVFYTAPPFALKQRGLGEPLVFLLTGPALTAAATLALVGHLTPAGLAIGIPPGLLATAVLYGNNLRDRSHDRRAGVRTLAQRLGRQARWGYPVLVFAAFITLIPLLELEILSPAGWVWTTASLPLFMPSARAAWMEDRSGLCAIDRRTAALHLVFCTLLGLGILWT